MLALISIFILARLSIERLSTTTATWSSSTNEIILVLFFTAQRRQHIWSEIHKTWISQMEKIEINRRTRTTERKKKSNILQNILNKNNRKEKEEEDASRRNKTLKKRIRKNLTNVLKSFLSFLPMQLAHLKS